MWRWNSPFCDSMDLKDGIVILEENLVQEICDEDLYILLYGDLNARTGCDQPKSRNGKHGIQMIPSAIKIFLRLFADDVIFMSSTPAGLQNQLNHLKMKQTACILVLTLIRQILWFFVWVEIWLREKDGCMVMKRSRLQRHIHFWE